MNLHGEMVAVFEPPRVCQIICNYVCFLNILKYFLIFIVYVARWLDHRRIHKYCLANVDTRSIYYRRYYRHKILDILWDDTEEARDYNRIYDAPYDIFDLTRLFGLRSYNEDIIEEIWALGWILFTLNQNFFSNSFPGTPQNGSKNNLYQISTRSNNGNPCPRLVKHLSSLILIFLHHQY